MRGVLNPMLIAAARAHFRRMYDAGYFEEDALQCPGMRDGLYCDVVGLLLQRELSPLIAEVVGEPVEPTYTWVKRYRPGAVLTRHTDRPQCRYNVSLAIDAEPESTREHAWPLWIDDRGTAHAARLGLGDAVVYSGTDTPHWREPLGPGSATMALLHYVATDFHGPRG
jgi:hypothetical protein